MIIKFNKTAEISTLNTVSGKRIWEDIGESVSIFLQPVSEKDFMLTDGNPADTFKAYTQGGNFKQTDRFTISGVVYDVRSVVDYDFGTQKYKKIIITKSK